MKVRSILLVSFFLFLICNASAFAVSLNYQGKLTDSAGNPENGTFSIQVNLYNEPTAGTPLFSETHPSVSVNEGIFSIIIGSITTLDPSIFDSNVSLYLAVSINGDPELTPRHLVTHVGFAILAENAETLDGQDASAFALAAHNHPGSDITSPVANAVNATTAANASNASNADLLDGLNSTAFASTAHNHPGSDITSAVANANNADLLDGLNSTAFANTSHTHAGADITSTVANATNANNSDLLDGLNSTSFLRSDAQSELSHLLGVSGSVFFGLNSHLLMGSDTGFGLGEFNVANITDTQTYTFTMGGTMWSSGNDGAGSTLDADSIDGLDSTTFVNKSGDTMSGPLTLDSFLPILTFKSNGNSYGRFWINPPTTDFIIEKDPDAPGFAWFRFFSNATTIENLRIIEGPNAPALFDGAVTANGLDYAESFRINDSSIEAGEVVSLDPAQKEYIQRTSKPYDPMILGVISTKPGYVTGNSFDAEEEADVQIAELRKQARAAKDLKADKEYTLQLMELVKQKNRPIALSGRVPVRVDGSYGAIKAGDYLTSSPTPGHAMAMTQSGRTVGMALEGFNSSAKGSILVFINPGWYGGSGEESRAESIRENKVEKIVENVGPQTNKEAAIPQQDSSEGSVQNISANSFNASSPDLAQYLAISSPVEAGDVLTVDRNDPTRMRPANTMADTGVVGIVASRPGVSLKSESTVKPDEAPVALAGVVFCKVDATYAPIRIGDLLVSSPTVGHAMRSDNPYPGTVIAKALESLDSGTGMIRVLVKGAL